METAGALKTPEYQVIKGQPGEVTKCMLGGVTGFTRYIGNESGRWEKPASALLDAPVLYAAFFEVYPAQVRIRYFVGFMTRKLSVTASH